MCKSPNEPGGPYRCSAHMKAALDSNRAHYAKATQDVAARAAAVEENRHRILQVQDSLARLGTESSPRLVQQIEDLRAQHANLEHALAKAQQHHNMWQDRLKTAIKNYDATIGGMQALSVEITQLNSHIEANPNDTEAFIRREALRLRADRGATRLTRERYLAFEEESRGVYRVLENHPGTPVPPINDESDELAHAQLDAALDSMIEREHIGAEVRTSNFVDSENGTVMSQHEIRAIAAKKRKEARAIVSRQRLADGDKKELMKVFMRQAMYRALRYNKHTRRIVRLVGVAQFNNFVDKIEDIQDLARQKKWQRRIDKWREKRNTILNEEEFHYNEERFRATQEYENKVASIDRKIQQQRISAEDGEVLKQTARHEMNTYHGAIDAELASIANERAKWAQEDAAKEERRRLHVETMREEVLARRQRMEQANQAEEDAQFWVDDQ